MEEVNLKICNKCEEYIDIRSKFCPICGNNSFLSLQLNNDNENNNTDENSNIDDKLDNIDLFLKSFSVNLDMFNTLRLLRGNIATYKAIFHGNVGTYKEDTIDKLAQYLYTIEKIDNNAANRIDFKDIPMDFVSNKLYVINKMEDAIKVLFNIDDFSDEIYQKQNDYNNKLLSLINSSRNSYIIINIETSQLPSLLRLNPKLQYVFTDVIFFEDLDNEILFDKYIELLPEFQKESLIINELRDELKMKFTNWMDKNKRYYPFNNLEISRYLADYTARYDTITFPPDKQDNYTLESSFKNIIGMNELKEQAYELEKYLKYASYVKSKGIKLPELRLHMMFMGDAGTGKTTIARILGKTLFDLGFIKENKFIETTSKDFVGVSVNQTSLKTSKLINQALGGVLFIDEAYSLSNSSGKSGEEAIALLVKAMEDYRDNLVVFLAGYTKEMGSFLKSNSGLSSRINYYFKFKNYNKEELLNIFRLKIKNTGLTLVETNEVLEKLNVLIDYSFTQKDTGNGRFIDKVIQKTLTLHATLVYENKCNPLEITHKDIPDLKELMKSFY